jgi:hypothetical protein
MAYIKIPVELRPAVEWTCDECGKIQFESIVADVSGEDSDEMDLLLPDTVKCKSCGHEFETIGFGEIVEG